MEARLLYFSSKDIEKFGGIMGRSIKPLGILRTPDCLYVKLDYKGQFIYAFNLKDKIGRHCKPIFTNDLDNCPDYAYGNAWKSTVISAIDVATLKAIHDHRSGKWIFLDNKMAKKMKNVDEHSVFLINPQKIVTL